MPRLSVGCSRADPDSSPRRSRPASRLVTTLRARTATQSEVKGTVAVRPHRTTRLAAPPRLLLTGATGGLVVLASAGIALLVLTATSAVTPPGSGTLPPLGGRTTGAGVVVVPTPAQQAAAPRAQAPEAAARAVALFLQGPRLQPSTLTATRTTPPGVAAQPLVLGSTAPAPGPAAVRVTRPAAVSAAVSAAAPSVAPVAAVRRGTAPALDPSTASLELLRAALRWSDSTVKASGAGQNGSQDLPGQLVQLLSADALQLVGQAGESDAAQSRPRAAAVPRAVTAASVPSAAVPSVAKAETAARKALTQLQQRAVQEWSKAQHDQAGKSRRAARPVRVAGRQQAQPTGQVQSARRAEQADKNADNSRQRRATSEHSREHADSRQGDRQHDASRGHSGD